MKLSKVILIAADEKDLELLLTEAKDRLKSTMDIADNLTNRSMTFFSFTVAALTTGIGYISTNFSLEANTVVLTPIMIILSVICSLLKNNIVPNEYFSIGSDPETIAVDGMFINLAKRRPRFYLLAHLIEAYNARIVNNRTENEKKASSLELAMFWAYIIPAAALTRYLLFFFFVEPFSK